MNVRRLFAASLLALLAPFLLAMPAQAAYEPTTIEEFAVTLTICREDLAAQKLEASYWRGDAEATARSLLAAEDRAEALASQLGQRTAERDRLRHVNNRLYFQRARLMGKVADLRERLASK